MGQTQYTQKPPQLLSHLYTLCSYNVWQPTPRLSGPFSRSLSHRSGPKHTVYLPGKIPRGRRSWEGGAPLDLSCRRFQRQGWRILLFVFLPRRDDDPSCPLPCCRRRPALAERLTATLHHPRATGHFDAWTCPCPQWGVPAELREPGNRVAQPMAHRSSCTDLDHICLTCWKKYFRTRETPAYCITNAAKARRLLVLFLLTRIISSN